MCFYIYSVLHKPLDSIAFPFARAKLFSDKIYPPVSRVDLVPENESDSLNLLYPLLLLFFPFFLRETKDFAMKG